MIIPQERIDFTSSQPLNWTIICEEMLDTQFSRVYFERARDELHRRFAWLTAGWLNFERCLWEWCNLDEQDLYRAIEWQYSDEN